MKVILKSTTFILGLSVVLSLSSCGKKKQDVTQQQVNTYQVLQIKPQAAQTQSDYPATIQGVQNIEIRPKINGYVEQIFVDEGQQVKKGQLLFAISAPQYQQDLATAEANVKIALADVNAAKMQVNKVKPLVDQDIVSSYQLESAKYTLQSRQAALAQANANVNNAKINLSYTRVYSPANGVIGILPYKIGSLVDSNTASPLTTVSNIDKIYAYFSINEKQGLDFFTSAKGTTMQEKLTTLPPVSLILANGFVLPQQGRVETASGIINAQTGAVNMRATFSNADGLVRSGSSAQVRIPQYLPNALLIPQKATYQIQGKTFVYLLDKSNKVKSVEVVIGSTTDQNYVVKSGIKAGDIIVADGIASLREGLEIKPQKTNVDFQKGNDVNTSTNPK